MSVAGIGLQPASPGHCQSPGSATAGTAKHSVGSKTGLAKENDRGGKRAISLAERLNNLAWDERRSHRPKRQRPI
jgi:hypothetical protein